MTPSRSLALALLAPVVALSSVSLVGCAIGDALQNERAAEFATTADVVDDWERPAPWLPDDATAIRVREAPGADAAVLLGTTSSPLDAADCVEVERRSAPVFGVEGSPDGYVDTVLVCGEWAVIPADDGWFGWTPIHPDEEAAAEQVG